MIQLKKRQHFIYQLILRREACSNAEIKEKLQDLYGDVSRVTVIRDVEALIESGLIKKVGAGRSVKYLPLEDNQLLYYVDPSSYFNVEQEKREVNATFNFEIFSSFQNLFTENELQKLHKLTQTYQENVKKLSPEIYEKEIERLTIELSWKSSQIEGNTYSLLDTEALLKENREASGHTKAEAIMILNHKYAIEYIFENPNEYKHFSLRKLEDLHRLLIQDLQVTPGIRSQLVRIVGTEYKPLDNAHQIKDALGKMFNTLKKYQDPFHKALILIAMLSYIQPFVDGNKRSARISGNAILNAYGACPLSYRSVDPVEYKKALLIFYERNSLHYFKELFISQYEFSVNTYFSAT